MMSSEREAQSADFLTEAFVTLPASLLAKYRDLNLTPNQFVILVQILFRSQTAGTTDLSPQDLSTLTGLSVPLVAEGIQDMVSRGFLALGQRIDEKGAESNYFDLKPLWDRLRGKDPLQSKSRQWKRDPVTLFEEEFGRPLSSLECDQIRQWMELDSYPDWLITEALREAVLANKFSFKYIDRILFEWQRHNIRTKQELDSYRQEYRDRMKEKTTGPSQGRRITRPRGSNQSPEGKSASERDERYSAFYQLFPDS